jgi:acylpyruvate hydrolase
MRIGLVLSDGQSRVVVQQGDGIRALRGGPSDPLTILLEGDSRNVANWLGGEIDPSQVTFLPPIPRPGKIICVGLNYADHAAESPYDKPEYPVYFLRVDTSLIGHGAPLLRPRISDHFDFEGEMVAVIGKTGRAIPIGKALDHVVAYSVFNDGSIRDYQFKGPQWTLGKNFDGTGAFGPFLVSSDEVPRGGEGLSIQTRLNGEVVQNANTRDLLFPVAELIARVSEAMTLLPGDIVVTGTPAGVGFARKPPLFMKHGDVCEVEVEGIGLLRNPVRDEAAP